MANLLIVLLVVFTVNTFAASCCGGSSGAINLITNEAKFKSSLTYSNKLYISDISSDKTITKRTRDEKEIREVLNLGFAKSVADFGQLSFEAGVVKITKNSDEDTSVSDLKFGYTYEFLPEIFYSPWKPRGFGYLLVDVPIGQSKFQYESKTGTDITSSGLYQVSAGFLFLKNIGQFEYRISSSVTKPLNRDFDNEIKVKKELGYSFSFDVNYSFFDTDWSVGFSQGLQRFGEEKIIKQDRQTISKPQIEHPTTLSVSYQFSEVYSVTGLFINNSLISGAQNTSGYKQISFSLAITQF